MVGAGRGPLVRASLSAAVRCGRRLRVYAVEKNPNAVVTLHALVAAEGCVQMCPRRLIWHVLAIVTLHALVAAEGCAGQCSCCLFWQCSLFDFII